jgi:hypothetical protein
VATEKNKGRHAPYLYGWIKEVQSYQILGEGGGGDVDKK